MSRLYCGTSGWMYPHWRARFYPEKLPQSQWLRYYSTYFDTVEINNSFYRLPEQATFEHWREEVPEDFTFAVKASRYLTHMKKLKDPEEPLLRVLANSSGLGPKRGPILYQLPPYWHVNTQRLEEFLQILPKDLRHVLEFRDSTWQTEEVWALLERYGVAYCVMDGPGLPLHVRATAGFAYIRLHYGTDNGNYPPEQLQWWAQHISELFGLGDVYLYFNNDQNGYAVNNGLLLLDMLR